MEEVTPAAQQPNASDLESGNSVVERAPLYNVDLVYEIVDLFLDGSTNEFAVFDDGPGPPNCVRVIVCGFDEQIRPAVLPWERRDEGRWAVEDVFVYKRLLAGAVGRVSVTKWVSRSHRGEPSRGPTFQLLGVPDDESHGYVLSLTFPRGILRHKELSHSRKVLTKFSTLFVNSLRQSKLQLWCNNDLKVLLRLTILHGLFFTAEQSMVALRILQDKEARGTKGLTFVSDSAAVTNYIPIVRALAAKIDITLKSLDLAGDSGSIKTTGQGRQEDYLTELQAVMETCQQRASDLLDMQDRRFNYMLAQVNLHESHSVKRLTILATVFLPLSLGTGLLSMQTRLTGLNLLLYDYVGVTLNVALAIFVYFIIGNSALWMRLVAHVERSKFQTFAARLSIGVSFLVLLVAFNIGVFRSVEVSVDVLKYGFAAIAALMLLTGSTYCVIWGISIPLWHLIWDHFVHDEF